MSRILLCSGLLVCSAIKPVFENKPGIMRRAEDELENGTLDEHRSVIIDGRGMMTHHVDSRSSLSLEEESAASDGVMDVAADTTAAATTAAGTTAAPAATTAAAAATTAAAGVTTAAAGATTAAAGATTAAAVATTPAIVAGTTAAAADVAAAGANATNATNTSNATAATDSDEDDDDLMWLKIVLIIIAVGLVLAIAIRALIIMKQGGAPTRAGAGYSFQRRSRHPSTAAAYDVNAGDNSQASDTGGQQGLLSSYKERRGKSTAQIGGASGEGSGQSAPEQQEAQAASGGGYRARRAASQAAVNSPGPEVEG